jgi:hypothetical protein
VAPKAAKWALVGPVLTTCGSQEGSLSEFSDSLGSMKFSEVRGGLRGDGIMLIGRKG